ncbi:MAG: DUF4197 domain-containing protein [Bacteroidetes bacterium]|nr:DUF4197 domain-containing protein [Bacteroidota bacterium]
MNKIITAFSIIFMLAACSSTELLEGINDVIGGTTASGALSQDEAGAGLKEALIKGITKGADIVSKLDGYYKNPKIKIPWPNDAIKVANTLTDMGLKKQVNKVVLTLNRGAEEAAKEAKPIFIDAIKKMTFKDALNILKGNNNAATNYLKKTTSPKLRSKFKPVIQKNLNKVGATKYWGDAINTYNKIPLVEKVNPDLNAYVTHKAMDGLFLMVGKEEAKIRKDPIARTTDLLKKVFGFYE